MNYGFWFIVLFSEGFASIKAALDTSGLKKKPLTYILIQDMTALQV